MAAVSQINSGSTQPWWNIKNDPPLTGHTYFATVKFADQTKKFLDFACQRFVDYLFAFELSGKSCEKCKLNEFLIAAWEDENTYFELSQKNGWDLFEHMVPGVTEKFPQDHPGLNEDEFVQLFSELQVAKPSGLIFETSGSNLCAVVVKKGRIFIFDPFGDAVRNDGNQQAYMCVFERLEEVAKFLVEKFLSCDSPLQIATFKSRK